MRSLAISAHRHPHEPPIAPAHPRTRNNATKIIGKTGRQTNLELFAAVTLLRDNCRFNFY
jgi:hypothetical protein